MAAGVSGLACLIVVFQRGTLELARCYRPCVRQMRMDSAAAAALLYNSSSVRVTLSRDRLLHIAAQPGGTSVSDDDVTAVMAATEALMAEGVVFSTVWDLRLCPVPSVGVTTRCVQWALKHKATLDKLNQRLGVVIPNNRAVAVLVATVLTTFGPTCEVRVSSNQVEALQFMARQKS